jgi:hypothetical protein
MIRANEPVTILEHQLAIFDAGFAARDVPAREVLAVEQRFFEPLCGVGGEGASAE